MPVGKWESDIDSVLLEFGVTKESLQKDAAEKLASALQDYHSLAEQHGIMVKKYTIEQKPVWRNGIWCCPACGKKVQYHHSYCHICGKRVGWDK